jgi:hypothetical protein
VEGSEVRVTFKWRGRKKQKFGIPLYINKEAEVLQGIGEEYQTPPPYIPLPKIDKVELKWRVIRTLIVPGAYN